MGDSGGGCSWWCGPGGAASPFSRLHPVRAVSPEWLRRGWPWFAAASTARAVLAR
jgi:hypothetical protein